MKMLWLWVVGSNRCYASLARSCTPSHRLQTNCKLLVMKVRVQKSDFGGIRNLRALYLHESGFQVRYDAYHHRGWTDSYLLLDSDTIIGYAAIKGRERNDRDTIFEFYVIPSYRQLSHELFVALVAMSQVSFVECQSNDIPFAELLFQFADNIGSSVMLFSDRSTTSHPLDGIIVRNRSANDVIFEHELEPVGDFVLEFGAEIIATGGYFTHYNAPFADLYMEVRKDSRRRGYATALLEALKIKCYAAGHIPAARCDIANIASRRALQKAGMDVCGFLLFGSLRTLPSS